MGKVELFKMPKSQKRLQGKREGETDPKNNKSLIYLTKNLKEPS